MAALSALRVALVGALSVAVLGIRKRSSRAERSASWGDAVNPQGSSMAFVHLFEWKWDDIAKECEEFLGPKGYTAVQVSPPQEHMSGSQWWTRYQPVSYNIISRSGDEAAFRNMTARCKAAGVGIYADGVINHMASGGGVGVGGTSYSNRNFPGTYSPDDFHHDNGNKYSNCGVNNYGNKWNVQYCDLVGLADLCTSCNYVQTRIGQYINYLRDLGIAGFRVDAAKHIDAGELAGIMGKIGGGLYSFLEVIGHSGEAVTPEMYYHLSDITEFNYAIKVAENFQEPGKLQYFSSFGESWGLMPTDLGVTFIDNHDTQRGHAGEAALTHKNGALYRIANVFMLAHPYGYPKVMSSYYFSDTDAGPPSQGVHQNGLNCFWGKPWVCEHRWPEIANMVAWRRSAGGAWVENWESHGGSRISFCRNGAACVLINREGYDWQASVSVSMPDGQYCNVQKSDEPNCPKVRVQGGRVSVNVPGMDAVAFHVGKQ